MSATQQSEVARDKLMQDFTEVVSDTENLLKSLASAGGEKATALRASIEQNLKVAKQRLVELEETALEQGRAAARATDEYVHVHPWQSIAIAAGIAAVAGVVLGLLLNRR